MVLIKFGTQNYIVLLRFKLKFYYKQFFQGSGEEKKRYKILNIVNFTVKLTYFELFENNPKLNGTHDFDNTINGECQ